MEARAFLEDFGEVFSVNSERAFGDVAFEGCATHQGFNRVSNGARGQEISEGGVGLRATELFQSLVELSAEHGAADGDIVEG